HRVAEYPLDERRVIRVEELVSYRSGCVCDHATRTAACRLYPLLPVLDVDGRLTGIDTHFGIYEELEEIDELPRACQVEAIPFDQLRPFIEIANHIGGNPVWVYYLTAFQQARAHVAARVREKKGQSAQSAFALFEMMLFAK